MIIVALLDTNVSVTTKVDLALESVSLSYKVVSPVARIF